MKVSTVQVEQLARQFVTYFGAMLIALAVDYGSYISLVNAFTVPPVPASLVGAVAGGIVAYLVNRAHVFDTERSHAEAGWRFALVALVGLGLTGFFMNIFINHLMLNYLVARVITSGITVIWSFFAHKLWSFGER
ncbi:GtrA family protein [Methylovirgula sp. 4M-Z18]|uniref:GtrA family protein n=1 Tax=Methylovirgula sp. 4M-Z18 TaxID=2293567 RepID=UPI000E2EEFED|nr:GtrA family protein [Methylovirgula sp. 4M-Z18]RFB81386.1 GtrA family protein [Methylovirgula sp. 4M-Z18]